MTPATHQPTAKIYAFPQQRLAAAAARREAARHDAEVRAAILAPVVSTGAWYHDEAIQDGQRGRR